MLMSRVFERRDFARTSLADYRSAGSRHSLLTNRVHPALGGRSPLFRDTRVVDAYATRDLDARFTASQRQMQRV